MIQTRGTGEDEHVRRRKQHGNQAERRGWCTGRPPGSGRRKRVRLDAGGEEGCGEHHRDRAGAQHEEAADGAKENTSAAARTLDGWETASGLKKVTETWDQQVKMLMGRVSAEKTSLRGTSGLFVQNDVRTGDELRALGPKSKLEGL